MYHYVDVFTVMTTVGAAVSAWRRAREAIHARSRRA